MIAANPPFNSSSPISAVPNPYRVRNHSRCRCSGDVIVLGFRSSPERSFWRFVGGGCFRRSATRQGLKVETDRGGSEDVFDAANTSANHAVPEHLVVMVNGIIGGSASDWRYAADQFVKKLPDKVIVHRECFRPNTCSECNSSRLTFDGVDLMGDRLAEEVLAVVRKRSEVRKISFVAHSLGGLVARYAIGRLYESFPESKRSGQNGNCLTEGNTDNLSVT